MLRIRICCICLIVFFAACKVTEKARAVESNIPVEKYLFPMDWIGHYEGELVIISPPNDTNKVKMQLIVDHPDALGIYPWVLVYGENDIRSYGLEAVNAVKGHYLIDEFNSIKIDSYLTGNHFVSRFKVLGSDLLVDYERVPEGIKVQLYVSQSNELRISGTEVIGKDTVPEVHSFRMLAVQTALLKKIK